MRLSGRGLRMGWVEHVAGEEMSVAGFFRSGLASEQLYERRLAIHQKVERGVDGVQVFERIKPIGAGAKFAGRLRAAKEEDANQGSFVAMEVEDVSEAMLVFGDAAIGGGGAGELLVGERVEGAADGFFVEVHHRLAIGFLVGGVLEGVERERVIVGSGDFFFDEAAEDASFGEREVEVHLNMIHDGLEGLRRAAPVRMETVRY